MTVDNYGDGFPDLLPDCTTQQGFFKVFTNENWTAEEKRGCKQKVYVGG